MEQNRFRYLSVRVMALLIAALCLTTVSDRGLPGPGVPGKCTLVARRYGRCAAAYLHMGLQYMDTQALPPVGTDHAPVPGGIYHHRPD